MANFDSKIFNPEAFGKYVNRVPKTKLNELLKSGVLRPRNELKNMLNEQTGGHYITIPLKGLLEGAPLNYDGATDITATSTTTYSQSMIVVGRAKGWVEKDFSFDITGEDFMDNVAQQVSGYWEDVDQDTILSILKGIFSSTNTGLTVFKTAHTNDISATANPNVDATTLNNTIQKASGDNKKVFRMAIMHSAVATNLENMQLIEYLKYTDKQGITRDLGIATWNGRMVLIDDSMPTEEVEASGDDPAYTKYTTYVLGEGAFDYVDCGAKVPYEMDRNPAINGGQDTLYTRQRKLFAPVGVSYLTATKLSPAQADLENGANWELAKSADGTKYYDHKAIPIARIISRG